MNDLKGKKAVITGGNSGIGFATAKKFAELGAQVMITGRSADKVSSAAESLSVIGAVADVQDLSQIDNLVDQVKREFGTIDILFVNAGIFAPAPIGQISEEMFDQQMGINFKGAIFTIEKLLPVLNEGASIINLSSINAYTGMPMTAVYAASKAALNAYTRTAATELAPRKIRVNAVNPGPTETPIFGKTGMSQEELGGFAQALQANIPLKRFAQPDEIASLVSYLASDDAAFVTGAEFNIDGGANINPILAG
ncbi:MULTISPECIES: SDR family oxidoreductase [Gammaproteobacteria]|uniref:SDR family NAD(P)-dependent oxidoreductase n=1 Tax=Gammaproteobacteria TaxID=1236 RepID=UPI0023584450|nr:MULTISPECIES: SDR family oxidoreductase [Gammaproteobacteria]MDC9575669.1 SDR family oxidoreductase [Pseudoalteromonas sp. GABNS16A]